MPHTSPAGGEGVRDNGLTYSHRTIEKEKETGMDTCHRRMVVTFTRRTFFYSLYDLSFCIRYFIYYTHIHSVFTFLLAFKYFESFFSSRIFYLFCIFFAHFYNTPFAGAFLQVTSYHWRK